MQRATHAQRWMTRGLAFAAVSMVSWSVWAAEPSIWYRTGEGCPDGASFLERLELRGIRGRLAAVGDRVEFVVTLGVSGEGSSGRLERQTSSGTIAIREVQAASCEAVADALALSLALAVEPESEKPPTPAPAPEVSPPASAAVEAPPRAGAAEPAPPALARRAQVATSASEGGGGVRLGGMLAAADLFEGPWLFQAGAFAEVEASSAFVLPRSALRVTLLGGLRPDANADAEARLWLAAARVEGCLLAVGAGPFSLRPCVGGEGGVIGASAHGISDRAAWGAAVAHARVGYDFGRLGVEGQAGGIVPLTHYEVTAAGSRATLEKTSSVGFSAAVGLSVRLE